MCTCNIYNAEFNTSEATNNSTYLSCDQRQKNLESFTNIQVESKLQLFAAPWRPPPLPLGLSRSPFHPAEDLDRENSTMVSKFIPTATTIVPTTSERVI